ncbi:hypothetical protein EST38_g7793 [Candolleomyces aberdarensis]|uniref:Xylanolytic transcriptional activator regulatory domain-containing protein n=1 Tax=Candolleomyces aberdarensis TaxID=2316362 RepID=A0A4Q2DE92_9AGAR|nr:hypothetical protein EST38_g7793 [Candolleomyces aberdarensis]
MDKLLRRLLPGVDLNEELNKSARSPGEDSPGKLVSLSEEREVLGKLSKLTLKPHSHRFFGKSSQYELIQTALDMREEYTGEGLAYVNPTLPMKRPEFWNVPEWIAHDPEIDEDERNYVFPEHDLYPQLVEAYFTHVNPFHPLLHQTTFEKQVADGLHHRDSMFAKVFLLVCAHGAQRCEDPRVLAEGATSTRSAGWKWFEQVNIFRRNLFNRVLLYELQMHALYVLFASSSEMPQGVWAQIGMALRLSQEVGGHRRRRNEDSGLPTAEDELWKRAFWVILSVDRWISQNSGRACGLQDEDFDLDLPLEVDDEYWGTGFVQPDGRPSVIAYFNSYLSLMDILAYSMRLIYSIKHPKFPRKGSERSEQEIIAELDAAMNKWMDSVPEHPAVILLLNIWSGKRTGFAPNPRREMEDVQRCMDMLRASERRWAAAGRFLDLLTELASAGDLGGAFHQSEAKSRKRSRSDTEAEGTDDSSSSGIPTTPAVVPETRRHIVGTRRVSLSQANSPVTPVEPPINFLLPMYSNDLGRLPVYGQFNFADTANVNAFLGEHLVGEPGAELFPSQSYTLDSLLKDAAFNSPMPPMASTSNLAGAAGIVRPPLTAADLASLFAQCSTDFSAFTQHLGAFGPHQPMIDLEMMKMWNTAPSSLQLDEWGTFISNVGQLTHASKPSSSSQPPN